MTGVNTRLTTHPTSAYPELRTTLNTNPVLDNVDEVNVGLIALMLMNSLNHGITEFCNQSITCGINSASKIICLLINGINIMIANRIKESKIKKISVTLNKCGNFHFSNRFTTG